MEVVHCFNFIMLFFLLIVSIANAAFLLRISYFLVKMFDYMKAIGRDEEYEEEEEEEEQVESPSPGLLDLPSVQSYADENMEEAQ